MCSPPLPPPARRSPPGPAAAVAVVCASLFVVLLGLVAADWAPLAAVDRAVAEALHRHAVAEPAVVRVNRVLTDWIWDPWTMRALTAVVVVALWRRGARAAACWTAVTAACAALLQQALKAVVGRERPQWPDPVDSAQYAAFPSGHAMTAVVTCGLLLWLLRLCGASPALWATALAVVAVSVPGVAFTRVYLGVHWLSDVVGGALAGTAVVACCAAGYGARSGRKDPAAPGQEGLAAPAREDPAASDRPHRM
ncbi:phosphatase PAP2 family protein [Streptomyces nitrosporeus]|uniref:Phosphatase PAP2 family protein n=1 Tax=Streptomyces nitrosporeus TaxID=28894 RepID=A0A5J6FHQ0_9ACTN|nr:phosphatase PAP2 family protein [Streptomyces nitrosporeus]QEU75888.1 phosphatase PAP2 family protein [Streptomyces nitrosporeus]GGY89154.1 hypothetical protein GCM10010327_19920 [Streptomyces nitrosporeus]